MSLTLGMSEELVGEGSLGIIWEADYIARELGLTKPQVYHAARAGKLPIGKFSGKLYAVRHQLREFFEQNASRTAEGAQ